MCLRHSSPRAISELYGVLISHLAILLFVSCSQAIVHSDSSRLEEMLDPRGSASRRLLHVLTLASILLPSEAQLANTFKYVGLSGVSAQQLFLGRPGKVYIVDKTGK